MSSDYAYTTAYGWAIKYEEAMQENEILKNAILKLFHIHNDGNSGSQHDSAAFSEARAKCVELAKSVS